MTVHVVGDKGAAGFHALAASADVLQRKARQLRAQPLPFVRGVDFSVRQIHHAIGALAVADVADDLAALDDFIAALFGVLAKFGAFSRLLGR